MLWQILELELKKRKGKNCLMELIKLSFKLVDILTKHLYEII